MFGNFEAKQVVLVEGAEGVVNFFLMLPAR